MYKSKKLKICVLGSTYPRSQNDHQVPWLRETVNQLRGRGHDVTVAASAFKGSRHHMIDGVQVLRFRYAPAFIEALTHDEGAPAKSKTILGKLLAILYILSGIVHMLHWSRKHDFDVINVHWPFPHALFTILPRALFGTKVVVTAHGAGMAMARQSKYVKLILGFVLSHSDSITCNSSHTKSEITRLTGATAQVIPYGATVEAKQAGRPFSRPRTRVLFSGRHIQRKGVGYLIEALSLVLKQRKDVELVITGHGDRTEEWKQIVTNLKLEDKVSFEGFVSNQRLAELYQSSDIYCLPAIHDDNSDTEGLGVVLIEALLHARPVIASGVGGIVDVIKHQETGILVKEKSSNDLAHALIYLIENPLRARELGEAGQKFVNNNFSWSTISDSLERVLIRATEQRDLFGTELQMAGVV